jgi:DHA1 family tetracycline resistance protein-like MFS transporter
MPTIQPARQVEPAPAVDRASQTILFLTVFVDLLGFGIVIPFLPMFAERLGVSAFGIGWILAIYSLAQLLFAPVLGRISDRFGRRPIIMVGLLGSSLSYLIYGCANSFTLLLLSRALHGACAATVPTAQAYIADTTSDEGRARGMGLIGAAFGLGFVLGPALGGLLGHSSLKVPVFFASVLTFANLIFAWQRLPESHAPQSDAPLYLATLADPLLSLPRQLFGHHLARLFGIAFLLTFALSALEATFTLMVPLLYGYGPAGLGLLLGYAGLTQAVAQGWLLGKIVARLGEMTLVTAGLVALAIGMFPMGMLSNLHALLVLLGLVSLGYGLASPSVASLISRRTGQHRQGEVLGVNQSAMSLARIFGPIAGASIYGMMGPAAPYVGGAVVAVAALALARGAEPERTN